MTCELCGERARFVSEHWLRHGEMLCLYWCARHAPVGAVYWDEDGCAEAEVSRIDEDGASGGGG